jgi:hypothetical protein
MAREQAGNDDLAVALRYKGVNFFQGLWGYKEVALFLGIAPKTVLTSGMRTGAKGSAITGVIGRQS